MLAITAANWAVATPHRIGDTALERAVENIGGGGFATAILNLANTLAAVDQAALFVADRQGVRGIGVASEQGEAQAHKAAACYAAGHWRHDPTLQRLISDSRKTCSRPLRLRPDEIRHAGFRRDWMERFQICDVLVLAAPFAAGLAVLHLHRHRNTGRFTSSAIAGFAASHRLLAGLISMHARFSNIAPDPAPAGRLDLAEIEMLLQGLGAGLTGRECAVLARLVSGLTTEGCALDLGLKPSSVATYRRRGYGRLNISSQAELFALLLARRSRCHLISGLSAEPPEGIVARTGQLEPT
ncbi:MAG: helix-turn-helix transcriptional regulator [Pararhodobacter sp.]|nr:helix-turn-helix transcriptional regulator [Pararhodobacter sp.]